MGLLDAIFTPNTLKPNPDFRFDPATGQVIGTPYKQPDFWDNLFNQEKADRALLANNAVQQMEPMSQYEHAIQSRLATADAAKYMPAFGQPVSKWTPEQFALGAGKIPEFENLQTSAANTAANIPTLAAANRAAGLNYGTEDYRAKMAAGLPTAQAAAERAQADYSARYYPELQRTITPQVENTLAGLATEGRVRPFREAADIAQADYTSKYYPQEQRLITPQVENTLARIAYEDELRPYQKGADLASLQASAAANKNLLAEQSLAGLLRTPEATAFARDEEARLRGQQASSERGLTPLRSIVAKETLGNEFTRQTRNIPDELALARGQTDIGLSTLPFDKLTAVNKGIVGTGISAQDVQNLPEILTARRNLAIGDAARSWHQPALPHYGLNIGPGGTYSSGIVPGTKSEEALKMEEMLSRTTGSSTPVAATAGGKPVPVPPASVYESSQRNPLTGMPIYKQISQAPPAATTNAPVAAPTTSAPTTNTVAAPIVPVQKNVRQVVDPKDMTNAELEEILTKRNREKAAKVAGGIAAVWKEAYRRAQASAYDPSKPNNLFNKYVLPAIGATLATPFAAPVEMLRK